MDLLLTAILFKLDGYGLLLLDIKTVLALGDLRDCLVRGEMPFNQSYAINFLRDSSFDNYSVP